MVRLRMSSRPWLIFFCLCLFLSSGRADEVTFTNLLAQGDAADKRGDVPWTLKLYRDAERGCTNSADLCVLTKRYCDLMHDTSSTALQKMLAEQALTCAKSAVKWDPLSSTAHLCVAVSYVKNFPYLDNQTKVNWSKAMKTECQTGIALDPKQDVGYYMLGRWHYGTANMGLFARGIVKMVYGGLPQASNEDAIKNYKQAIVLAPNRIIHHAALAQVYETIGDKKLAISELEMCATLKPWDRDDEEAQKEAATRLKALK